VVGSVPAVPIRTLTALVLVVLAAACVPPEDDDSIPRFDPKETLAGKIQKRGVLVVGVEEDAGPVASVSGGGLEGFTVEMGRWLAEGLGVDAEFVAGTTDELATMVSDDEVDVAFPMTPITEAALDEHLFSDPYFVAHQRLLVPESSAIGGVEDLSGQTVCEVPDPTGVEVAGLNPDVADSMRADPVDCLQELEAGRVDAISAADIVLIPLVARSGEPLEMVGDDLTTAGYGAMAGRDPLGLDSYIDSVFAEADQEGRWAELYAEWIGPYADDPEAEPPAMTFEEAAAINPL
jgi:polar amino acid transport system substrate-binding protein